jgi:hypothetical protein
LQSIGLLFCFLFKRSLDQFSALRMTVLTVVVYYGFPQFLQADAGIVSYNNPSLFSATFSQFIICCCPSIWCCVTCEFRSSLNKPRNWDWGKLWKFLVRTAGVLSEIWTWYLSSIGHAHYCYSVMLRIAFVVMVPSELVFKYYTSANEVYVHHIHCNLFSQHSLILG